MKKAALALVAALAFSSAAAFADSFDDGGFNDGRYAGPFIEPITIVDVRESEPNAYIIASGIITRQNIPGIYTLTDTEDETISILVYIGDFAWKNLEFDGETPVVVYGWVIKSDSDIRILADRVGLPEEEQGGM
ncbi:hypothetical protein FACS1894151_04860 [Spirochaetia bacterium]|nr:hypothetical protein FACS1894151_04860 [Spirochaetia bacterium]